MPKFDGTGPRSEGPLTGRGMGPCGSGFGGGYGRGSGFRKFFSKKEMSIDLESYRDEIKAELNAVEEEIQNQNK
jgi:hypothetical protein